MSTRAEFDAFFQAFPAVTADVDVSIAPQMAQLPVVGRAMKDKNIHLCTQNLSTEVKGAYTGEVSPVTLADLGVKYAIVGHGERRAMGETDDVVAKKVKNALAHGIRPILCVGENLDQRKAGNAIAIIKNQMAIALEGVDANEVDVAYEPLRSIGTGVIPTLDEIKEIHDLLRTLSSGASRLLYGGSANDVNGAEIFALDNVNGFLVGGASLDPLKFSKMVEIVSQS